MSAEPSRAAAALVLGAGLAGGLGVAAAATAAHLGASGLETAARFLLAHAPALLGLALLEGRAAARLRLAARAAGLLLALGLALFCGDLAARALLGGRLFAMAAPIGGIALMLGWAALALGGAATLLGRRPAG